MIDREDLIETVNSELAELCCDLVVLSYDDIEDKSDAMMLILITMLYFALEGFTNAKFSKERMLELVNDTLNSIEEKNDE